MDSAGAPVVSRGGAEVRGGAENYCRGRVPCSRASVLSIHDPKVFGWSGGAICCARSGASAGRAVVAGQGATLRASA